MLSRTVAKTIREQGDVHYPFLRVENFLRGADLVFANLETPITPGREIRAGEMMFRTNPEMAKVLKEENITVVSLANNHTPNFGQKGLHDTFRYLSEAGVQYVGAGKNEEDARAPIFVERHGTKFAFLAFNDTDAGTAFMDVAKMTQQVKKIRSQADVVIVSMHSGKEYIYMPNHSQTTFARAAIGAGADLVIGHHPHVVQKMEIYKDKPIFYSLGNFIFDQMWSEPTKEGVMLQLAFEGPKLKRVTFIPVYIENYAQPHVADAKVLQHVLERLGLRSDQRMLEFH